MQDLKDRVVVIVRRFLAFRKVERLLTDRTGWGNDFQTEFGTCRNVREAARPLMDPALFQSPHPDPIAILELLVLQEAGNRFLFADIFRRACVLLQATEVRCWSGAALHLHQCALSHMSLWALQRYPSSSSFVSGHALIICHRIIAALPLPEDRRHALTALGTRSTTPDWCSDSTILGHVVSEQPGSLLPGNVDWASIGRNIPRRLLMVLAFVSSLEVVMRMGNEENWFELAMMGLFQAWGLELPQTCKEEVDAKDREEMGRSKRQRLLDMQERYQKAAKIARVCAMVDDMREALPSFMRGSA